MSKLKTKPKLQTESERLDPTASCKKIIEELPLKNKNTFDFYRKCLGKRSKSIPGAHWHLIGHPVSKFPDNWDGEINCNYFDRFYYKSTLPKYISLIKNIGSNDPVTEILRLKREWHAQYILLQRNTVRLFHRFEKLDEDILYCPKIMVNLLKHQASEPDPNFTSSYNWFYAGHGNLHIVTFNNKDYLLHSEFNTLHLTEFIKNELKISENHTCLFVCGEDNNIFETLIENNIIVLRCRYRIFILKILETDKSLSFEQIKNVYSEVPYTAVNFDKFHKNILYITKLDNNLTIVNMDRMTAKNIELKKPLSLVDNWNSVMYVDREHYCHISPKCIEIYDKRTSSSGGVWTALTQNLDSNCNQISVAEKIGDCFYLGTTHHILSLDVRYSKTFKPLMLQRWNHNMKCCPTYMLEMSKGLLCMASQWCEDMRMFVSESNDIVRGQTVCTAPLPYSPPNIYNTLDEAKWGMHCLDMYNPIDDRLSTCISGVSVYDDGEGYVTLMQNSLGDISRHLIYPEHEEMFIQDDSVESLHEWSKSYKEKPKKYEVNDVKNVYGKLMDLCDVTDDLSFLETKNDDVRFSSKETVETFTSNTIESGLLDAWNIGDTDLNLDL